MIETIINARNEVGEKVSATITIDALDFTVQNFTIVEIAPADEKSRIHFQDLQLIPYTRLGWVDYLLGKGVTDGVNINHSNDEKVNWTLGDAIEGKYLTVWLTNETAGQIFHFANEDPAEHTLHISRLMLHGVEGEVTYVAIGPKKDYEFGEGGIEIPKEDIPEDETLFHVIMQGLIDEEPYVSEIIMEVSTLPFTILMDGPKVNIPLIPLVEPEPEELQIDIQLKLGGEGPEVHLLNSYAGEDLGMKQITLLRKFDLSEFTNIIHIGLFNFPEGDTISYGGSLPPDPTNDYSIMIVLVDSSEQTWVFNSVMHLEIDSPPSTITLDPLELPMP